MAGQHKDEEGMQRRDFIRVASAGALLAPLAAPEPLATTFDGAPRVEIALYPGTAQPDD